MSVTLAQLAAFVWTARLGTVHAAAARLNLAQPTVSLRLRELQGRLGRSLFQRDGRVLKLTADGALLVEPAARMLDGAALLEECLSGPPPIAGRVAIGMQETFAIAALSPLLADLGGLYPDLRPELLVETSATLQSALAEGRLDLAFVSDPTPDAHLVQVPLGLQDAVWAASPAFRLDRPVRPKELALLPILATPPGSPMHRQTMAWFATAGEHPARLSLCSSVSVIAHLVRTGVAVAILPRRMVAGALEAGDVVALRSMPPLPPTQVSALYRDEPGSPALVRTIAVLRRAQAVLGAGGFLRQPEAPMGAGGDAAKAPPAAPARRRPRARS